MQESISLIKGPHTPAARHQRCADASVCYSCKASTSACHLGIRVYECMDRSSVTLSHPGGVSEGMDMMSGPGGRWNET